MPELPEVETTRRGIAPHLLGRHIKGVTVRQPRLRWEVPAAGDRREPFPHLYRALLVDEVVEVRELPPP